MIYNVRDYGALGDGVTDDRLAIQAAVNAARDAGGGEVYIPSGVYVVTGQSKPSDGAIKLYDNVTVYGDGMGATTVRLKDGWSGDVTGIFRTPTGVENHDVGLHDLTIDGNRDNTSGKVDGWFNGVSPGKPGADVNVTLDHVEIKNCEGYGFDPHEQTVNLSITNSVSHGNGLDGFTLDFQIGATISNNVAYDNDRHGFNIVTSTHDIVLTDNIAYGNGSQGIMVQRGSDDIPVPNNIQIVRGEYYGNGGDGIQINKADHVSVDGAEIYGNGQRGVRIMGSVGSVIENSHIHDNSASKFGGYEEIRIQSYDDTTGVSGRIYATTGTEIHNNVISEAVQGQSSYAVREATDGTDYSSIVENTILGSNKNVPALYGTHSFYLDPQFDLHGTTANETLTGGNNNDMLYGNGGDDILNAGGGNDKLEGGSGNDKLYGGDGKDTVNGGSGSDLLYGGAGDDTLYGQSDKDSLFGDDGKDKLNGGSGDDKLNGGAGNDTLIGEAGNDQLTGGTGADTFQFSGSFGQDTILDFTHGEDRLNLSSLLAANFSEVMQHVTVNGANTVITFGTDSITLAGFTTPLEESDVRLY